MHLAMKLLLRKTGPLKSHANIYTDRGRVWFWYTDRPIRIHNWPFSVNFSSLKHWEMLLTMKVRFTYGWSAPYPCHIDRCTYNHVGDDARLRKRAQEEVQEIARNGKEKEKQSMNSYGCHFHPHHCCALPFWHPAWVVHFLFLSSNPNRLIKMYIYIYNLNGIRPLPTPGFTWDRKRFVFLILASLPGFT